MADAATVFVPVKVSVAVAALPPLLKPLNKQVCPVEPVAVIPKV
jgi:hypothetical protein